MLPVNRLPTRLRMINRTGGTTDHVAELAVSMWLLYMQATSGALIVIHRDDIGGSPVKKSRMALAYEKQS